MELQDEVKRKDEEIVFLRSMLASLSEKVDHLEKTAVGKLGKICNMKLLRTRVSLSGHGTPLGGRE